MASMKKKGDVRTLDEIELEKNPDAFTFKPNAHLYIDGVRNYASPASSPKKTEKVESVDTP